MKDKIIRLIDRHYLKQKDKNLPIYNNKLTPIFIKKLNKSNFIKVANKKEDLNCSICLEEINIENYQHNKTDLVFLNCDHVFHKQCLNTWVKTKVQNFNNPDCPLCRNKIINNNFVKINIVYESDSSGMDSDEYFS
jgi:hypothetical protein